MRKTNTENTNKMLTRPLGANPPSHTKPLSSAPHCFICDEEIVGRGVPLLLGHTPYSRTGLPTKIGQLMGEGFMVVVSLEDMLCKRCAVLLNHLDKLEADLTIVRNALLAYLTVKYRLNDSEEETEESQQNGCRRQNDNDDNLYEEIDISEDAEDLDEHIEWLDDRVDEYQEVVVDQESLDGRAQDHLSEDSEGSKKMNVEIILDKSSQQRAKCSEPNKRSGESHSLEAVDIENIGNCEEFASFKCSMCDRRFENHKCIRRHVMEVHLSKWTCHFCDVSFTEEADFTSHTKTHLSNMSGRLKSSDEDHSPSSIDKNNSLSTATVKKAELTKTLLERENVDISDAFEENFECNICEFASQDKRIFDDHLRKHVVLKLFKCKFCSKRFEENELVRQHVSEYHKPVSYECDTCPAAFEIENELIEHTKSHETLQLDQNEVGQGAVEVKGVGNPNLITMPTSLTNFDVAGTEQTIQNNANSSEEIELLICSTCSITFVNKSMYSKHMKVHEGKNDDALTQQLDNSSANTAQERYTFVSDSQDNQEYVELELSFEEMLAKIEAGGHNASNQPDRSGKTIQVQSLNTSLKCVVCNLEFVDTSLLQEHQVSQGHLENVVLQDDTVMGGNDTLHSVSLEMAESQQTSENQELETERTETGNDSSEEGYFDDSTNVVNIITCANGVLPDEALLQGGVKYVFDVGNGQQLIANSSDGIESFSDFCEVQIKTEHMDALSNLEAHSNNSEDFSLPSNLKKTFVCAVCGYRSSLMVDLKNHFKAHKNDQNHRCNVCNKIFTTQQKLTTHMKIHKRSTSKLAGEEPEANKPQQVKQSREKLLYKCQFCEEEFSTKKAYKAHEEVHPDMFSLKCDECDQQFTKEKQLRDHKDTTHRDPHCRFCGKEILKAKTLKNHELRHIREKDHFECDVCKRVFKTKTGLRHHVAVHTGEYKYCCDYCGRGFMSRMMMEEHRSMHTKEERYICDVCGRKFSFQSTYWIHRKWHDNPYPYKCNFCSRLFRHSSLLAVHKRKHTGERPYKCPHCPLTFPVGGTLKRHLILHTGVYPFNCDSCNRGFTTRHKYATHLAKVHSEFELLNNKPQTEDFKMVIREEGKQPPAFQELTMWDEGEHDTLNFKLEGIGGDDDMSKDTSMEGISCTIVSDDLLVENMVPTRVVEIVLDEASQAVATVTLADHTTNMLPEFWYQECQQ
uniref:C2H2-type domain-containing protein n=2 Tax=Timema bartmani TaxID=61472 RepID=A0A7R9F835_9NEOP|nr:unnamed protein product [Timema bartmani]